LQKKLAGVQSDCRLKINDQKKTPNQICVASAVVALKSGKFSSRAAPSSRPIGLGLAFIRDGLFQSHRAVTLSSRPFSFEPALAAGIRETAR
jgi:hypothetical protein